MDSNDSSCYQIANDSDDTANTNCYDVCIDLILDTNLTTRACLAGNTSAIDDDDHDDDEEDDDDDEVTDSEGQL